MKDKKSFVFHREWYEALKDLDDSIRLEVYDAIMCRVFQDGDVELSSLANMAMCFITPQLQRDIDRYDIICESRKAFGRKGGVAKASKSQQKVAKGGKSKQNVASVADNDNDNDIKEPKGSMNIIKEKDTNVSSKKEKFDVRADLSYVNVDYYPIWIEWLDYKDKIKKQYKTDVGAKKQYNHLVSLANGDVNKARAIVDQSIMREYEGLFDVKDYKSAQMSIDEQAEKEGFPYKDEFGKHYETMWDRNNHQNSYEEYLEIKNRRR